MTKQNEFAFSEMVSYDNGFVLIRYDTMDDFSHKVDMIETDQYKEVRKRFVDAVMKNAAIGMDKVLPQGQRQLPIQSQQPRTPPMPRQQQPRPQPQAQAPEPPDQAAVEDIANQYPDVESYLESIDFAISDKSPHPIAYFKTLKQGKFPIGYLNVYCDDQGMWGMNKWMKKEKKQHDFDYTWATEYQEIMAVVDAIDGRLKAEGQ